MTAPVALPARLYVVAGWDVPLLRRAVALLAGTVDRLSPWRARLEGVGRALESGDSWSGPAARSAVAALADVSAVTSAIGSAVEESLSIYERLVAEAAPAQDAGPAGAGRRMSGGGADAALRHAAPRGRRRGRAPAGRAGRPGRA